MRRKVLQVQLYHGEIAVQVLIVASKLEGIAAATDDREVDVELTASGFTPIISLNIKPSDKFNVALKYEFNTKLEYTTKVNNNLDGGGSSTMVFMGKVVNKPSRNRERGVSDIIYINEAY